MKEKLTIKFTYDDKFAEAYNSGYRATTSKLVDEKYARKMIQDTLKSYGVFNAMVTRLYMSKNGIDTEGEHCLVFGIQLPPLSFISDYYSPIMDKIVENT